VAEFSSHQKMDSLLGDSIFNTGTEYKNQRNINLKASLNNNRKIEKVGKFYSNYYPKAKGENEIFVAYMHMKITKHFIYTMAIPGKHSEMTPKELYDFKKLNITVSCKKSKLLLIRNTTVIQLH